MVFLVTIGCSSVSPSADSPPDSPPVGQAEPPVELKHQTQDEEILAMRVQAEALYTNPRARAILDVIAEVDGQYHDEPGYDRYYVTTDERITDFSDHPRKVFGNCSQQGMLSGTWNSVTDQYRWLSVVQPSPHTSLPCVDSAGRYGLLSWSWDEVARGWLSDFSPPSQDLAALFLVVSSGAWDKFEQGKLAEGFQRLNGKWVLGDTPFGNLTKDEADFLIERYHVHLQEQEQSALLRERMNTLSHPVSQSPGEGISPQPQRTLPSAITDRLNN